MQFISGRADSRVLFRIGKSSLNNLFFANKRHNAL